MSRIITHKYKKFSKITAKLCKKLKLPLYNSQYSNKIFTNQQKLFLLVYKEEKHLTYRQLEEDLYDSKIPEYLGLKRIPRWTTLQMFAKTIEANFMERLIRATANLVEQIGSIAGIDSTGMSLDTASQHYCKRIDRKNYAKGFLTLQALSDLDNQTVRAVRIHRKRMHDSRHLIPLWNKGKSTEIITFVADKGYDSENNLRHLYDNNVIPLISMKYMHLPRRKTGGRTRKLMKERFDWGLYHQRSKCETIFSSIKRKYGSVLKCRTLKTQKIEILMKVLCYNINKVIDAFVKLCFTVRVWS